MINPAEQFNMVRPNIKEKTDEKTVDLALAEQIKERNDAIIGGRLLHSLSQNELNKVLKGYKEIERALGIAEKKIENPSITTKTPEGKEITFNMEQILNESKEFYQSINMPEWVNELPDTIELTEDQIQNIKEKVEKFGFNRMKVFPSIETQNQTLAKLMQETTKPIKGLEDAEQYSDKGFCLSSTVESEFPDKIRNINRPEGCYIQLYKDDQEVPSETLDKTYPEAREYQKENNLQGYTLAEYAIFQMEFTKENKIHPEQNNYTWLTDSEIGDVPSVQVLDSDWNSDDQQVLVHSDVSGLHVGRLGFRSSAVLEI